MADTQSLGEFLRREREKRGITIEQVASATKIGVRVLHALEADHYAELPAKPFIRGFVTSYARFVGLDAKEVINQFDSFIDSRLQNRPARAGEFSGYAFEKREGEQSRTVLWIIMGSFLVMGSLIMFILKPSLRHSRHSAADRLRAMHGSPVPGGEDVAMAPEGTEAAPSPKATVAAEPSPAPVITPAAPPKKVAEKAPEKAPEPKPKPKPTPAPAPKAPVAVATPPAAAAAPTPAAKPPAATPGAPAAPAAGTPPLEVEGKPDPLNSGVNLKTAEIKHKIIANALADVWVRYQCDNRPVMKFLLKKGKTLVLRGRESIRLQASNPSSIKMNYNFGGNKLMADQKNLALRQDTPTVIFPTQLSKTIEDPFPGERPLPTTPGPQ